MKNKQKTTRRKNAMWAVMLVAAMMAPVVTRAQVEQLTTCRGQQQYVLHAPFYTFWTGLYYRTEHIIPADSIADMVGATIEKLGYEISPEAPSTSYGGTASFGPMIVMLTTTTESTIGSEWLTDTVADRVYTGMVTLNGNMLDITLDTGFAYTGGNLVVGFCQPQNGGNELPSGHFWKGCAATNGSCKQASSNQSTYGIGSPSGAAAYLPQTTFTYSVVDDGSVCFKPSGIVIDDITAYSASLSFASRLAHTGYTLLYAPHPTDPTADTQEDDVVMLTLADTTYEMDGLEHGTHYYIYIAASCSSGEQSEWAEAEFSTEMACYPVGNLHVTGKTMTNIAFGWDIDTRGDESQAVSVTLRDLTDTTIAPVTEMAMGATMHIYSDLDIEHEYSITVTNQCAADAADGVTLEFGWTGCGETELGESSSTFYPMAMNYAYTYAQMLYLADEVAGLDSIRGIALRHTDGYAAPIERTVDVWMDTTTLTDLTANVPATNMVQVASQATFVVKNAEWDTLMFDTPFAYDGTSNVLLTINNTTNDASLSMSQSPAWYSHEGAAMLYRNSTLIHNADTVVLGTNKATKAWNDPTPLVADTRFVGACTRFIADCQPAVSAVTAVDASSATVVWVAADEAIIQYREVGGSEWIEGTKTSESPATLNGLAAATAYEVRVATVCDGDSLFGAVQTIVTDCEVEHIPFALEQEDVAAAVATGLGTCWDTIGVSIESASATGVSYIYGNSSQSLIVLPAIAEPLQGTQVRTMASTTGIDGAFRVGVVEGSAVVWIDTIAVAQGATADDAAEYIVPLTAYTGTGNRVAIGRLTGSNVYHLAIVVEEADACPMVSNLAVDDITVGSATISWDDNSDNQWLVYVDGELQGMSVTSNYDLTGLQQAQLYEVEVRALCQDNDTSRAKSIVFRTECGDIEALPYSESFEGHDANAAPVCWTVFNDIVTNPHVEQNQAMAYVGQMFLYDYMTTQHPQSVYATPMLVAQANTLQGEIYVNGYSYHNAYGYAQPHDGIRLEIGLLTDNSDTTGFVVVKDTVVNTYDTNALVGRWVRVPFWATMSGVTENAALAIRATLMNEADYGYFRVDALYVNNDGTPGVAPVVDEPVEEPSPCDNAPVVTSVSAESTSIALAWAGEATAYEVAVAAGTSIDNGTVQTTTATSYTFEALQPSTVYTVGVRSVCGDERSEWATRTISTQQRRTPGDEPEPHEGIDGAEESVGLTIYPNPASQSVVVSAKAGEACVIELIDQSGRCAMRIATTEPTTTIDLGNVAVGTYFVRLTSESGIGIKKLVVAR